MLFPHLGSPPSPQSSGFHALPPRFVPLPKAFGHTPDFLPFGFGHWFAGIPSSGNCLTRRLRGRKATVCSSVPAPGNAFLSVHISRLRAELGDASRAGRERRGRVPLPLCGRSAASFFCRPWCPETGSAPGIKRLVRPRALKCGLSRSDRGREKNLHPSLFPQGKGRKGVVAEHFRAPRSFPRSRKSRKQTAELFKSPFPPARRSNAVLKRPRATPSFPYPVGGPAPLDCSLDTNKALET